MTTSGLPRLGSRWAPTLRSVKCFASLPPLIILLQEPSTFKKLLELCIVFNKLCKEALPHAPNFAKILKREETEQPDVTAGSQWRPLDGAVQDEAELLRRKWARRQLVTSPGLKGAPTAEISSTASHPAASVILPLSSGWAVSRPSM